MKAIYNDMNVLRNDGIKALEKELGIVGTAQFIRMLNKGQGNYTEEREEILKDITMKDIEEQIGNV